MSLRQRGYLIEGKMLKWGFDKVDMGSAATWKKIVKAFRLKHSAVNPNPARFGPDYKRQHWKGSGLLIVTANNPITGHRDEGGAGPGWAGYIGLEGDQQKVEKAVAMIKKLAVDIGGESKHKRSYI